MNIILKRTAFRKDGIFGVLLDETNNELYHTLEHAYENGGNYEPKIPPGSYTCKRGEHRLEHMTNSFTTFQVDVPGHTNILFHVGNYNEDSEGCILLGISTAPALTRSCDMLLNSTKAFNEFMALQSGANEFTLTVEGK